MVARMNRIETAARLAMADFGTELPVHSAQSGMTLAVKLGLVLASLTIAGVITASLL